MSRTTKLFGSAGVPSPTTKNPDGYPAYDRPLAEVLVQILNTGTLGNTYYSSAKDQLKQADRVIDEAIAADPELVARAAINARNEGYMRTLPTYALAKLAKADPKTFAKAFDRVVLIPSDLQDFMTMVRETRSGSQGGRAIKRRAAAFLANLSEYHAVKYNGAGRGYTLGDIVATAHPKPKDDRQKRLFKWLMTGGSDLEDLPQVRALEALKTAQGPEAARIISEAKLPHEAVTGIGNMTPSAWNALVPDMPLFALLRNINTLERHGVLEANRPIIERKLSDGAAYRKAKIHPLRLLTAMYQIQSPWVKDALRLAMEATVQNLPEVKGRTAIFLDSSGSMGSPIGDPMSFLHSRPTNSPPAFLTASVFAISLYKKTSGNTLFYTFDGSIRKHSMSKVDSVLSQAMALNCPGGCTYTELCMKTLLREGEKVDNVMLVTDMVQNRGDPFIVDLQKYRRTVNKDLKAFLIDMQPYTGAMTPDSDKQTFYVYGWSDIVPAYVAKMTQGFGGQLEAVRGVEL